MKQIDKDTLDGLLKKGMISDKTHALYLADGGSVPDVLAQLEPEKNMSVDPSAVPVQAPVPMAAQAPANTAPADPAQAYLQNLRGNLSKVLPPPSNLTPEQSAAQTLYGVPAPQAAAPVAEQAAPVAPDVAPGSLAVNKQPEAYNPYPEMAKGMGKAFDTIQSGIVEGAAAGARQGAAEAAWLHTQQKALETEMQVDQQRQAAQRDLIDKRRGIYEKTVDDYTNAPDIDPHRMWNNMSTGSKVAAGIGLILGGFGSNGNQAVKVINDAIGRDIDAQKASIDKRGRVNDMQKGLYSDFLRQFGDERSAEAGTRAAMITNAQLGLQARAAQFKTPEVLAQAQQAYGQLELQRQQALQSLYQTSLTSPQAMGIDQDTQKLVYGAKALGIKPEDAFKEYGEHTKIENAKKNIDDTYKKMAALQTIGARAGSPIQSKSQIDNLNAAMVTQVIDMSPTKRLTPETYKAEIEPYFVKFTDSPETIMKKRDNLKKLVDQNATPTPIIDKLGIRKAPLSLNAPVRSK